MSTDDSTRSTGRGGLAVAGAKVYFIVLGVVQQTGLRAVLGLDGFGALSRVTTITSLLANPITTMSIQAASRSVVQARPEELSATIRRMFLWQAAFGVVAAGLVALFAPQIAALFGAGHVETPLRILASILFVYALYTPLVGVANGQRRFLLQAGLDVTAATLRTLGLVGGAYVAQRLGRSGPTGSALGFAGSTTLVLLVAAFVIGIGSVGPSRLSFGRYAALAAPLLGGQLALNALFQADALLLGRFATQAATAAAAPMSSADELVGAYRATQQFSFLPYQVLIAISFILFPMLATAAKANDPDAIARYVRTGVRLALLIAGAMVSVSLGLAPRLIELLFGAKDAALGGRSLTLLAVGLGAFAIFGILTTVLNSLGRELQSLAVTVFAVLIVAGLCFARARGTPLSEELLWRTAQATTTGLFTATLAAAVLVWRAAGAVAPPLTLLRVCVSLGAAALLGRTLFPAGKVLTLVAAAVIPCFYLLLLVLLRELGRADLELVRKVVRR
jgi:stage V sporulation protein B